MKPSPKPATRASAIALALSLALSAAAAASDGVASLESPAPDGADAPAAGAAAGAVDPMDALLDFSACMRENGVDMPDPQPAGEGGAFVIAIGQDDDGAAATGAIDADAFRQAEEACGDLLEALDTPDDDPERDAEIMDRLLQFAACMRAEGIDMPDPVVQGGDVRIRAYDDGALLDPFSDDFQAAREACRDLDPLSGPGLWNS